MRELAKFTAKASDRTAFNNCEQVKRAATEILAIAAMAVIKSIDTRQVKRCHVENETRYWIMMAVAAVESEFQASAIAYQKNVEIDASIKRPGLITDDSLWISANASFGQVGDEYASHVSTEHLSHRRLR